MRMSLFYMSALVVVTACAGRTASSGAREPTRPMGGSSSTLITEQEILRGSYSTALEVIENLRPTMLRSRGATLSNPNTTTGFSVDQATSVNVVVFLDEVRLGDVDRLSAIPAASVREIRYINARDATTRWGTGVSSGVIQVISKK